jgi:hypothetical protein
LPIGALLKPFVGHSKVPKAGGDGCVLKRLQPSERGGASVIEFLYALSSRPKTQIKSMT